MENVIVNVIDFKQKMYFKFQHDTGILLFHFLAPQVLYKSYRINSVNSVNIVSSVKGSATSIPVCIFLMSN